MSLHLLGLYYKWQEVCRRVYQGYWNELTNTQRANIRTNFFMAGTKIRKDNVLSIKCINSVFSHYFIGSVLTGLHLFIGLATPFIAILFAVVEYYQDCNTKHVNIVAGRKGTYPNEDFD